MLPATDPLAATPFILREHFPIADRLTRWRCVCTKFATETEAVAAFKASKVRSANVVEITGIGSGRLIIKRSKR